MAAASSAPGQSEYLGSSTIVPGPALDRARLMTASAHNDSGATKLFLASQAWLGYALTSYPFFFHAIFAGLIPPFSTFFTAVLDHYRIRPLHLHPNSVLVLAIFVCPAVALFRCFFSAQIFRRHRPWMRRLPHRGRLRRLVPSAWAAEEGREPPQALGVFGCTRLRCPLRDPLQASSKALRLESEGDGC